MKFAEPPLQTLVHPSSAGSEVEEDLTVYTEIKVRLPLIASIPCGGELSDDELVRAAADSETFKFLADPEEDIYSD